jgi:hypothetical protein
MAQRSRAVKNWFRLWRETDKFVFVQFLSKYLPNSKSVPYEIA